MKILASPFREKVVICIQSILASLSFYAIKQWGKKIIKHIPKWTFFSSKFPNFVMLILVFSEIFYYRILLVRLVAIWPIFFVKDLKGQYHLVTRYFWIVHCMAFSKHWYEVAPSSACMSMASRELVPSFH